VFEPKKRLAIATRTLAVRSGSEINSRAQTNLIRQPPTYAAGKITNRSLKITGGKTTEKPSPGNTGHRTKRMNAGGRKGNAKPLRNAPHQKGDVNYPKDVGSPGKGAKSLSVAHTGGI